VIHHEVVLALTMLAVAGLTWAAPNQVGTQTFMVLWVMRLSAKLNVFLGVRNLTEQFVPEHLRYLRTYFRRAPMNPLMPFSVLTASVVVFRLAVAAWVPDALAFEVVGRTLVATILALAVLEHVFLALPVPDAVLWRWATQTKRGLPQPAPSP
jgi:putative photosynthetic complex assembly protein 2